MPTIHERVTPVIEADEEAPNYPPPPIDSIEASWWGYRTKTMALDDKGNIGLVLVEDRERYAAHFGPYAWSRDLKHLHWGANAVVSYGYEDLFDANGPTLPLDEFRAEAEKRYAAKKAEEAIPDEDPFWVALAPELPPKPKNPDWMGVYRSLAYPAAKDFLSAWKQAEQTDKGQGKYISTLATADREPPPPMLLGRLHPNKATVLFGPGDIGKGTVASSWITQLQALGHTVLILDYEDHIEEWAQRIFGLAGQDALGAVHHVSPLKEWGGPIWSHADAIRKLCDEQGVTYLVIDSAGHACAGVDPAKPEAPIQYGEALQIIERPSLTLAHVTKTHDARYPYGSVYWHNVPRISWSFMPKGLDRLLVCRKANNYEKPGASSVTFTYHNHVLREVWERPAVYTLEDRIAEVLSDSTPMTPTEIAAQLNDGLEAGEQTSPTSISGTLSRGVRKQGTAYRFAVTEGGRWRLREGASTGTING